MQLHQLKPTHKKKARKRIGRGGKRGTFSGRGSKGQKVRAGHRLQPLIREIIKQYPKLRGYRFNPLRSAVSLVSLADLDDKFRAGEKVSPKSLVAKKIISKIKGKVPQVKILVRGTLHKPLIIENCYVSASAREKIEKAGGKVKSKIKNQNAK
jgi:large subunit ribosomal protein L15